MGAHSLMGVHQSVAVARCSQALSHPPFNNLPPYSTVALRSEFTHTYLKMTTLEDLTSLDDVCKQAYEDLSHHKHRFLVYKLDDKIVLKAKGDPDATYEDYLTHFGGDEVNFGIFAFEDTFRQALMGWRGPSADMKKKMMYETVYDFLKSRKGFKYIVHKSEYEDRAELEAAHDTVLESLTAPGRD